MYNPMKSSSESSHGIPCIRRFTTSRWKIIWLVLIVVVETVVILTYSGLHCAPSPLIATVTSGRSPSLTTVAPKEYIRDFHGKHSRRRFPHFIVIGVKKSGTRALLNFLNMHPDIMTASSEVHFFDRDETYNKSLEWYRKQMPYSYQEQLTGEKSPSYFREAVVPERIHRMNSSIKLILVVREPIDRCMSNYLQFMEKESTHPSFEHEILLPNGDVNPRSPLVFNSDYNLFIDNWLKWFDRSQLKVVDGNLLITNPATVLQELEEFLGLRNYIDGDFFKYNAKKGFFCYYNHSSTLKCLGESKGRKHPPINPVTRAKLYHYFEPRNKMFFEKIGKRFDWERAQLTPTEGDVVNS